MEQNIQNPEPDNAQFTFYWNLFINDVTERENFKMGHLEPLRILCLLYIEYHDLCKIIKSEGYLYENDGGRNGSQLKPNPCVAIRDKTLAEIRQYSKLLGLILKEDKEVNGKEKEEDEWQ